jgi:hypothetical protein
MSTPNRIIGKKGALYYAGVKLADVYDCTVTIATSMEECSAWGDDWDVNVPNRGNWKMTAKKYAVAANLGYFKSEAIKTPKAAIPVRVILYAVDGGAKVHEGDGWVQQGDITVPKGMVDESLEILGTGDPVT